MSKSDRILPDEVQSAAVAAREMLSVVKQTSNFWGKQLLFALVPLVLGGVAGWFYVMPMSGDDLSLLKEALLAFITVVTVLSGFIVTLMLFTGRTSGADSLNLDMTNEYIDKIVYLQFTQMVTLVVHVICLMVSLVWLLALSCKASDVVLRILFVMSASLMFLSLVRTVLMPFQIFEVHYFELTALRKIKVDEFKEKVDFFSEIKADKDKDKDKD